MTTGGALLGSFDYVVVGGGTAGAVIAARLAEDSGCTVALLEAGPSDEGHPDILELQRWPQLLRSAYDYDYTVEPQSQANSDIRHSRGRMLGGCSSHNAGAAWRVPDRDLNRWVQAGATGWGPSDCTNAFDRVVDRIGIEHASDDNDAAAAFIDAASLIGFPKKQWNARAEQPGVGWVPINARGGSRRSSSASYLHPLDQLPRNLSVFTNTTATRVVFDGHRACSVNTSRGVVHARAEVILSAGAFDSPKLLMLSGVGPAAQLGDLGIPLVSDLPVGVGLLDHPEGAVVYEATWAIRQPHTTWVDAVAVANTESIPDDLNGEPDAMIWFFSGYFDEFTDNAGGPSGRPAFTIGNDVLYARSEGTVRLRSANPADPPRIDLRYFTDPDGYDERKLLQGLKLSRRIAKQAPLRPWIRREVAPGPSVSTDDELLAYGRSTAYTAYHPTATCRIGAVGSPRAVVDSALRVYGVEGLRIADASVFPTQIGVNPAIACMMVGERCADFIHGDRAPDHARVVVGDPLEAAR